MTKYLKLIWFAEETWTKYHAAVGIDAKATLCGRDRGIISPYGKTRRILPNEKLPFPEVWNHPQKCSKCLAILNSKYGHEHVDRVKVA